MSTTFKYLVREGDTYESISRRIYGTAQGADRIRAANPGAQDSLRAGDTLLVPQDPEAPEDRPTRSEAGGPDEMGIRIGGRLFRGWTSVTITRSLDSFDTMSIEAPLEPDDDVFRETFQPLSFKAFTADLGGSRLFTGTLLQIQPQIEGGARTVRAAGYAAAAVLGDCTLPASAFPKTGYTGSTIDEIARDVCAYFGLGVRFEADPGEAFEAAGTSIWDSPGVAIKASKKVFPFLKSLAQQRKLVIGSDPDGGLVFRRPAPGVEPAHEFVEGAPGLLRISAEFNPQSFFSHVTGISPTVLGIKGAQYTEVNPFVETLRPYTFDVNDASTAAAVQEAVQAKAGRMYANAVGYSLATPSWRTADEALWAPGQTVRVLAPGAMIYEACDFVVRRVSLVRSSKGASAELALVLPGAFQGKKPERLPWMSA